MYRDCERWEQEDGAIKREEVDSERLRWVGVPQESNGEISALIPVFCRRKEEAIK